MAPIVRPVRADRDFVIEPDTIARAWLASHRSSEPLLITYEVKHCCGGGRICNVQVRERSRRDNVSDHVSAVQKDGSKFLVDPRAATRLPTRFGLTVRGFGPLKHLTLALSGEQWGTLLYD